jgi:lysophospholipase L1-like esterase
LSGRVTPRPRVRRLTVVVWVVGVLAFVAMAVAIAIGWGGNDDGPAPALPDAEVTVTVTRSTALRVAVVGDSNTVVLSPDFSGGDIDPGSWAAQLFTGDDLVFAGGWAVSGSTTVDQAAAFAPVESDVLVILSGTNDLAFGVPFAETAASLQRIADTSGAPRVVVLAIPPIAFSTNPTPRVFNERLAALANENGWEYVDALAFLRDADGGWIDGTTTDGVHLSPDAQARFGANVADYLRR